MTPLSAQARLEAALEALAALEHERWSHWQAHLHAHARRHPDGSLTLPTDLVLRWERQIATPYSGLSEAEKESDREQVRRTWPLLIAAFSGTSEPQP